MAAIRKTRAVLLTILNFYSLGSFAQAPVVDEAHVLDAVCVADQARQCFEKIFPAKAAVQGIGCGPGIAVDVLNIHINLGGQPCVRSVISSRADIDTFIPALQACDANARLQPAPGCIKRLPIAEVLSATTESTRGLMVQLCKAYASTKSPVNLTRCDALNSDAAPGP